MKYAVIVSGLVLWAAIVCAEHGPSLDRGKELFESPALGTNGRSCVTCHPGGKKLDWVGTYDDARLSAIIATCIRKPLHGTPLPADSDDLKSLILYIRSFAGR